MKKFYILFLILTSSISFAQDPVLFDTDWQLGSLTIGGNNYIPPSNGEVPAVPLNIDMGIVYSLNTSVCNQGSGIISFNTPNSFTLDFFNITLILCDSPENATFEGLYFGQFFTQNQTEVYTYAIGYLGDSPFLIIYKANGDQAFYYSNNMSKKSFNKHLFNIFPNPVSDILTIKFADDIFESATIEIYNSVGTTCLKQALQSDTVNVGHLPSGVYFIRINKDNVTSIEKLVKL